MKNIIFLSILLLTSALIKAEGFIKPKVPIPYLSSLKIENVKNLGVDDLIISFNRSTENIEISAPRTTGVFEFRVYSILGKVVLKNKLKFYKEKTLVNTSQLIDGIYILSMQSEEGKSRTFKFIK